MLGLVWFLAGCEGASKHLVRGDELSKIGLQEEALAEYQLAAKEKPKDPEVTQHIAQAKKLMAKNANEGGLLALKSKDYPLATTSFKKAVELDATQEPYSQNLKRVVEARVSEARQVIQKGDFEKGILAIQAILNELPNNPIAQQALNEAESGRAEKLLESANQYEQRGLYGNALVTLIKLRKMHGAYKDSPARENACRDKLIASSDYAVRLAPNRVAGQWKTGNDQMLVFLRGQKTQKCPIFSWSDGENNRLTVNIGLDGVVFAQTTVNNPAQQKYQSGVRKVDNLKYKEIKSAIKQGRKRVAELNELLKKDEQEVEKMRQAFSDASLADDDTAIKNQLNEAQKQLADHKAEVIREKDQELKLRDDLTRTPRKLDEPIFDTHTYQVATVTRTATAKVKVVATRQAKEEVFKETFTGSTSVGDKTNPANKKYSVEADPLQFSKTDADLAQEAISTAANTIFKRIEERCGRWQDELISSARQVTKKYVLYLFSTRDQSTPEVTEFFKQYHQLDDVGALLRGTGL
jgi:tetratricopeptide (TPR) repeat protein